MIGRLLRNGEVLADSVECDISRDYRRDDGRVGWRGETWIPIEVHLLPGDKVTWQPQDGAPIAVLVERITVGGRAGRMLVRFSSIDPQEEDKSQMETA